MVAPSSPAEESGLAKDDEIISVNNLKVEYNLSELFGYFSEKEITLDVFTQNEKRTLKLSTGKDEFYSLYSITPVNDASVIQKANFINWCSLVHS